MYKGMRGVPNPLDTLDDYLRYSNMDIPELDDEELEDEFWALRPGLWGLESGHWLRERVRAVKEEMDRRRKKEYRPRRQMARGIEL